MLWISATDAPDLRSVTDSINRGGPMDQRRLAPWHGARRLVQRLDQPDPVGRAYKAGLAQGLELAQVGLQANPRLFGLRQLGACALQSGLSDLLHLLRV
jgi:hypothetical protein